MKRETDALVRIFSVAEKTCRAKSRLANRISLSLTPIPPSFLRFRLPQTSLRLRPLQASVRIVIALIASASSLLLPQSRHRISRPNGCSAVLQASPQTLEWYPLKPVSALLPEVPLSWPYDQARVSLPCLIVARNSRERSEDDPFATPSASDIRFGLSHAVV